MNLLKQFWILVSFFLVGELISFTVPSPLPGNVTGFILLVLSLKMGFLKESSISDVSDFLLKNLAILFIPGGVGLIQVMHLFNGNIIKIFLVLLISTVLTLLATAGSILLMEKLKK